MMKISWVFFGGAWGGGGTVRFGMLELDWPVADLYTLIHSGYFTMVIFENDGNQLGFFSGVHGEEVERLGLACL